MAEACGAAAAVTGTGTVVNKSGIKQYQQATRDRSKVRSACFGPHCPAALLLQSWLGLGRGRALFDMVYKVSGCLACALRLLKVLSLCR